jgi:alkaline phosphatase D
MLRTLRTSRRRFLKVAGATTTLTAAGGIARPYLSRAADRPQASHGVQSGDVSVDSGIVWARADRPARLQIEVATTDSFRAPRGVFVDALPVTDLTAKALIEPACRTGHLLSRPLPGSRRADHSGRAGGRPLPHRAG